MELNKEETRQLIKELAGEDAVQIVDYLVDNGEDISEFTMAEKLDTGINRIRNMLYRLQENNLVTFMRKKDKKKGWYIYYWTFNKVQSKLLIKKLKQERIKTLKKRLEKEQEEFFTCSRKCLRISLNNALENTFMCPNCGKVLKRVSNESKKTEIKRELDLLTKVTEEAIA
jgi:transcription initiation factor TFIIE subunit alpha